MAARVIAQAIIQGTAVVGRAFFAAYQQALKSILIYLIFY